jgi:2-dehydropantoate 2-reductase
LKAPIGLVPAVLRLPTPVFRVVAKPMISVSAGARSSMQDDLTRGRPTEVDALNGEIVATARAHGGDAPINARIVQLVHAAEGNGSPRLSADALRREVGLS